MKTEITTKIAIALFFVFAAFCDSFSEHASADFPFLSILLAVFYSSMFLGLLSFLAGTPSWIASQSATQWIAVFFSSSQKTLAAGVPIAAVVFASRSGNLAQGPILNPLMIYHALQLVLAGLVSGFLVTRNQIAS
ncbi:MAG: bile acid:sodium symporter [Verrucomicrobiota bacterium]|nr:bile acid:sodium symporter [Verrucomicrobiota bacterium]